MGVWDIISNPNTWVIIKKFYTRIKRRFNINDISPTAGELIVAILESKGTALKTSCGICVDVDKQNAPFISGIWKEERMSDDDAIEELCDRGLLRACNNTLYRVTKRARRHAETLKKLDEKRIFLYAPKEVKERFSIMKNNGAFLEILPQNDNFATVTMNSEGEFSIVAVLRKNAEKMLEYLYREKLVKTIRIIDENGKDRGGFIIGDNGTDFRTIKLFHFKQPKLVGEISERGRRIASIDLTNFK